MNDMKTGLIFPAGALACFLRRVPAIRDSEQDMLHGARRAFRSESGTLRSATNQTASLWVEWVGTSETSTIADLFQTGDQRRKRVCEEPNAPSGKSRWSEEKNQRRCELVDKEIDATISGEEQAELEQLQTEMLAYRRKVAPLPLDDLRALHQQLLVRAGEREEAIQ